MKFGTYKCVVPDRSVYGHDTSLECDHDHRTYSGARRCLENLSETHPDGTCNLWAYSGTVWVFTDLGWGSPPLSVTADYDEQMVRKIVTEIIAGGKS